MERFYNNPKWLLRFAPFRALSLSAAYLVPFFLERGLSLADIFILQAIFSFAVVILELPSGYFADRFGRAFSMKLSLPLAVLSMVAYGLSGEFWQFVVCELLLAAANGLISGADSALLYDSLHAQGREDEYEKTSKHINSRVFLATVVGLPVSFVLASQFGLAATLIADGVLTGIGGYFVWQLVDTPNSSKRDIKSALRALHDAARRSEVRWLITLTIMLSTGTYMAAWFSAKAYLDVGIPVVAFAGLLAIRSLWKAGWSHHYHPTRRPGGHLWLYVGLLAVGLVAMASGQLWLLWLVLGIDVVQAMQGPALLQRLNDHVPRGDHRATLNSAVNLLQRLSYACVGPVVGVISDTGGLQSGLLATGALCCGVACFALGRLHRLGTFREKG